MEFRILGRFEALDDERELSLGGARQRAVLAVLLVHRREVVSIDRLVDELWGERPPPTAAQTVRVYVSRLRKTLGDGLLETHGRGYLLAVDPAEIDAERFEALVADGRAALESGDARRGAELLSAGLELWRGPPLEEFAYEPFAQSEIARLEEARLVALEDRIEAELRIGRGTELVPELEQLVADHPLHERLVAGLMLALYRSGRQADALAEYRVARERLVGELGLGPGPELRELERRILQHDPTLAPARAAARAAAPVSRRARLPVLAMSLGVVLVAAFLLGFGAAHPGQPTLASSSGVVAVNVASGRIVSATRLSGAPGAVGAGGGSVWVADPGAGDVSRVDPGSGVVVDEIPVGGEPGSIVGGDGAIWIASAVGAAVTRIDPTTQRVTQTISLPGANLGAIAYGDGRLWVADSVEHELFEINPTTGSLQRTFSLDLQPSAIAAAGGTVWVAGYGNATVEQLDPTSGRVIARVRVGDGPAALALAAGSLWVANSLDSTVSRVEPSTLAVAATIPVGSGPTALASASGSVWVANQYSGTVSRIDPRRALVVRSVKVAGQPTSLAVSGGSVWVGVAVDNARHRGGTLVIVSAQALVSSSPNASIDPAIYSNATNPQFTGLAYDSLVNFEQSAGAEGLRLIPDLALSIPTPGDGGTTYTFRIRPKIRYSDGQPLRAGDFRRAFERLFRVASPGAPLFEGIVGAQACIRRPATCDLSRGIVTNDTTGAVTFRLTAPDPDFLFQLTEFAFAAPIPPGTPDHETGQRAVPGTGPYKIASVSDREVRFVRNPFFHEWSHAAQPEGYPDVIVWRIVPTDRAGVTAIERGQADWLFGQIPAAQYDQLKLQDPAQLHSNPQFAVEFVPLNTHLAPFNDLRVRQAFNYAINRAKIARQYGGPSSATPTCQLIAPGLPGYRRYCPYTLHPRADGAWSAPDMARARRLVALSGTLGERIDVWGLRDQGFVPPTAESYVAGVLRALGYHVHLHLVSSGTLTQALQRRIQLDVDGDWLAPYPYPSSYVPAFVTCGGGNSNGWYCNPSLDREIQQAELPELADPRKASALWASIDRQLTNTAVWVPTVNLLDLEVTSRRLSNYQYNPVWGFLADQAWLR
jgi:YVTN family beta-propeller protein